MRRSHRKRQKLFRERQSRRRTKNKRVALRAKRASQARKRAFKALVKTRRGEASFTAATRAERISLRAALKYVGKYLRRAQSKGGRIRYLPIKSDRAVLNMFVITEFGYEPIRVRGSQAASLLGKHTAAVQKFLRNKGDSSVLAAFRGKRVAGHELITDPQLLLTLGRAGALRLDELYAVPTGAA